MNEKLTKRVYVKNEENVIKFSGKLQTFVHIFARY